MCSCSRTCTNRILQNGVRVKLEVFKTEKKVAFSLLYCFQESILTSLHVDSQGWALRAAETILRGMFVCEYVGEVLDEQEANKRRHRFHISSDWCFFCFLYVNIYVIYIKRTLVLSGIGKKVAAICMTLMLIWMIWADWWRDRSHMWLMRQSMEMFHGSSITGDKSSSDFFFFFGLQFYTYFKGHWI